MWIVFRVIFAIIIISIIFGIIFNGFGMMRQPTFSSQAGFGICSDSFCSFGFSVGFLGGHAAMDIGMKNVKLGFLEEDTLEAR